MKYLIVSLLVISSTNITKAMADEEVSHHPVRNCDMRLGLSDSQKLEIKELTKASDEKLSELKVEIKKAELESELVLSKVNSSKAEAALATEALLLKQSEAHALKKASKLAVLFDVLSPEQRIKKLKCEKGSRDSHHRRSYNPGRSTYRPTGRAPYPYRPGPIVTRPGRVVVRPAHAPYHRPSRPVYPSRRGGRVYP